MRKASKRPIEPRVKSGVESIHSIDENHFKNAVQLEHFYRPDHFTVIFLKKGSININYNLEDVSLVAPAIMFTVPDSQFVLKSRGEDISLLSLFYSPDYVAEAGLHMTG